MSKDEIINRIKLSLLKFPEILFAYIFGSFLEKDNYNDIDIAVYVKEDYNPFVFPVKIKEEISKSFERSLIPDLFDVKILNDAPFYIMGKIMADGKLIIDNDFEKRAQLAESISLKFRECEGILKEASLL